MFKIATWNVNSLAVRIDQVLAWLNETSTDVLALQETKVPDERFPEEIFQAAGLHVCFSGQKAYNGVALVSRHPLSDVVFGIPGFIDEQRRVIAATVAGVRVIDVYVPNGAAVGTDKYQYKLSWLDALRNYIEQALKEYPRLIVLGDFNIAPADIDVHDPAYWEGSVLVSEPERNALNSLLNLGLIDSFRALYPEKIQYSWWDYRQGRFRRNHGLRIDLILSSQILHEVCHAVDVDEKPRGHDRPSDHTPVSIDLSYS